MTAKKYLEQVETFQLKIKHKKKELDKLKNINHNGSEEKIAVLEAEINSDIASSYEIRNEIINRIYGLGNKLYIDILCRRYVIGEKSFFKIAYEMNYAYKYIINMHGLAIKTFEEKYHDFLNGI